MIRHSLALHTLMPLLLLYLSGCGVSAEEGIEFGKPERNGMSVERLQRITAHMDKRVENGIMAGGLGMIARNGKVVYTRTWGEMDREAGKPMEEDTIFRIYSMSKPITSVAVMMLYEEGRFFLNDPVAEYIPELANLKVALSTAGSEGGTMSDGTTSGGADAGDETQAGLSREPARQPTIRDLLAHTAGMTYGIFGSTEVDRLYREAAVFEAEDLQDFVTRLGKLPLQYDPGSRWHYSVSVDVQGRLVEAISGMSFGEFLQQRIFEPLGMKDTGFVVPADNLSRFAQLYSPEGTKIEPGEAWEPVFSSKLEVADPEISRDYIEGGGLESGGGGLVSTAEDYMRFSMMMLNGGELNGVRLLSPKSVELMTRNHLGDIPGAWGQPGLGFGLGYAVLMDIGQSGELGSDGAYYWGGAAGTRFWIDPEEDLIGIFMVQSLPHQTTLADEFRVMTYQSIVD